MQDLIDSLYTYNDWANQKIVVLCDGLTDEQLDQPRAMGFGSLRATLYHILSADTIWLERWQRLAWRPFPTDPGGISVASIDDALKEISIRRQALISAERETQWSQVISYRDSKQTPYQHHLRDLLLHVFVHGVHHRAQALSFLKQIGRKVTGGIDYLFYRLAEGSQVQATATVAALRNYGLSVNDQIGPSVQWDASLVQRLFEYSDWATAKVLAVASGLRDPELDRPFDIGQGSIRKILLHMYDAERWWNTNWSAGSSPFPHSSTTTSVPDLATAWRETAAERNAFLASLDNLGAQRALEISLGGPPIRLQVGDTAVQLTGHGAHHRAQLVNLFRQVEAPIGNIDLLYALAELG